MEPLYWKSQVAPISESSRIPPTAKKLADGLRLTEAPAKGKKKYHNKVNDHKISVECISSTSDSYLGKEIGLSNLSPRCIRPFGYM